MRISIATGIVVLICLLGGLGAGLVIWTKYQEVDELQTSAEQLALAELDFRQLKTLTNQWFVAIDLFFSGTQSYAAQSIVRQASELGDVIEALAAVSGLSFVASQRQLDAITTVVSDLAIKGPGHADWHTGLARVDDVSIAIVDTLEDARESNSVRLAAAKSALEGARSELDQVVVLAGFVYVLFVMLGWSWANRKVVMPLQVLQRCTRVDGAVIEPRLRNAPFEIAELAGTLRLYSEKVLSRQHTIEEQNQQLAEQLVEIERTRDQLIQAEKLASVGQLAAGVAHEINNPMSFVSTNLSSLEQSCQDIAACLQAQRVFLDGLAAQVHDDGAVELEKVRGLWDEMDMDFALEDLVDIFKECKDGTSRITAIVSQLSEFTDGSQTPARCNLQQVVTGTVNQLDGQRFDITGPSDVAVMCPEVRLNQAVRVLCENALEALQEGEARVQIEFGGDAQTAWITVRDQGCGISQENQSKIFDPFFTTKDVGEGIGLGLHFAQATAQQAGGELAVESMLGKGSTFTLRLPMQSMRIDASTDTEIGAAA